MDFKDVYKLPLEKYEGTDKVFHANGHMAFDFLRMSHTSTLQSQVRKNLQWQ